MVKTCEFHEPGSTALLLTVKRVSLSEAMRVEFYGGRWVLYRPWMVVSVEHSVQERQIYSQSKFLFC